jgi:serine/threonine-protein kinase
MLLGTPFYMAPEQMFGEKDIDHRADLWAIGVILYEALSGQRPAQGANMGQILKVIAKDGIVPLHKVVTGLPAPVLDLVSRLLEQERERRPADLREVVRVLAPYTSAVVESFGVPRPVAESLVATPVAAPRVKVDSEDAHAPTVDASLQARKGRWPRFVAIGAFAVGATGVVATAVLRRPAEPIASPVSPATGVSAALVPVAVVNDAASAPPAAVDASIAPASTSAVPPPLPSLGNRNHPRAPSARGDAGKDPLEGQY